MIEGSAGDNEIAGGWDNEIAGGWDTCSAKHVGVAVLGQKTETEPLGLDFGCTTANGSGARWRGVLGCWGRWDSGG
jgi:hypothetical protein